MAVSENLTEQDLAIIDTLDNGIYTQRKIAEEVGLSLGMVNLLLKKLIQKGYIKIRKINKRRILYYLTPEAIEEKTRKTYRFLKTTVKTLGLIKAKTREKILEKIEQGYISFNVVRQSDLTDIAIIVLMDLSRKFPHIQFNESDSIIDNPAMCNIVATDDNNCKNCINLLDLMLQD